MHQHRHRRLLAAFIVAGAFLVPLPAMHAQTPADNSKVNQRDRNQGAATADQQKENATDRALTQKIRRELMADKTLSTYAHNVKIITRDGRVTLKGPVRTPEEKQSVEAKATAIAGSGHIVNQISIAPAKGAKQ